VNKKKYKKPKKDYPDEVHNLGPMSIARYGNLNVLQSNLSEEEHKAFIEKLAKEHTQVVEDINKVVLEIRDLVSSVDPVQLLHRNYYFMFSKHIGIKSESDLDTEQITSLRMIDYVQSVIASTNSKSKLIEINDNFFEELKNKVSCLYGTLGHLYILSRSAHQQINNKDFNFKFDAIFVQALLLWINVRGDRYQIHNNPHLSDLLLPHTDVFYELFSITVEDFIKGLDKIQHSLSKGLGLSLIDFIDTYNSLVSTTERNAEETENDYHNRLKEKLKTDNEKFIKTEKSFNEAFGFDLFDIEKNTNWPKKLLDELSWKPGENDTFFSDGEFSGWPLRIEPIKTRPFLYVNDSYYCFDSTTLMDYIYRIIQKTIIRLKPTYQEEWNSEQKKITEELPLQLFKEILPHATIYKSIYYRWYPEGSKKKDWQEADGLIICDDHLIIIEIKAGAFTYTSPAEDFPAYIDSIKNLIQKPAKQGKRFLDYLKNEERTVIYDSTHKKIDTLSHRDFRQFTICCVTLDSFTTLASKAERLSGIGVKIDDYPIWSVSISDLRVYKDIFTSPHVFLHYLEQRQTAITSLEVETADELDHLGLYLTHNNYASIAEDLGKEGKVFWDGYRKNIDEYFADLFSEPETAVRPEQEMPQLYKSIIKLTKNKADKNYTKAIGILLDKSGDERNNLDEKVSEILVKQSNVNRPIPLNAYGDSTTIIFCRQESFKYPDEGWIKDYIFKAILGSNSDEILAIIIDFNNNRLVGTKFSFYNLDDIPKNRIEEFKADLPKRYESLKSEILKSSGRKKVGRNEQCPCGSGKKHKHCHG